MNDGSPKINLDVVRYDLAEQVKNLDPFGPDPYILLQIVDAFILVLNDPATDAAWYLVDKFNWPDVEHDYSRTGAWARLSEEERQEREEWRRKLLSKGDKT